MKSKRIVSAIAILSMLQGCSIVRRELRHSGGFAGDILDERMFDARASKRLQLLRFTMVLALTSRVGAATIRDASEASAFVTSLQNTSDEVNFLAGHLYGQNDNGVIRFSCPTLTFTGAPAAASREATPTAVPPDNQRQVSEAVDAPQPATQCDTYEALFESDIPQLEYRIVRLVLAALPQRQAAQFLRSARSGNVLSAAWQFLKLAAAAADGFHRGAAVYRSSQEILAIAVFSSRNSDSLPVGRGDVRCATSPPTDDRIRTIEDATACLGLSQDHLFQNPAEANVGFPREIGDEPFQALYEIIRTSCGLLPIVVGLNSAEEPAKERRANCARLEFAPRLRFGGRTSWEAVARPAPAQPQPDGTQPATNPDGE